MMQPPDSYMVSFVITRPAANTTRPLIVIPVDSHHLFFLIITDYLILYTKANEKTKERDETRRINLVIKGQDAKQAAALLEEKSEAVKNLVKQRQPKPKQAPPPPAATPVSSSADRNKRSASAEAPSSADTGGQPKSAKRAKTSTSSGKAKFDPKSYLKRRIAKDFDGEIYFGSVKSHIPAADNEEGEPLWLIEYDDGDAEDLEKKEMLHGFKLYHKHAASDK
jgi:hypothetical protein